MRIQAKELIFKQHSVNCITNIQKSQILVESVWVNTKTKQSGSDWLDATEWDKKEVYDFLNY